MTPSRSRVVQYSILIILITIGARQSFGIFLPALSESLEMDRQFFGFVMGLLNLILGLPLAGILADRFGPRWIAVGGGLLYAAGPVLVAVFQDKWTFAIAFSVIMGLALSATSYVVVLGAVAQVVPVERQSRAFGLITAAGSVGIFVVVPALQWILDNFGWEVAFYAISGMVLMVVALATQFPTRPRRAGQADDSLSQAEQSFMQTVTKAFQNGNYWLLMAGFFVCGFHVAFISTHFPAFLEDSGITGEFFGFAISGLAFSLIGLFNLFGSSSFGYWGDFYRKKYLLAIIYFARAVIITIFIWLPLTSASAIIFACAMGFFWLATVPLTSGAISQIFGSRYLATLYGMVFLSHQVGAFLSSWIGGIVFDRFGNYNSMWIASIILGVLAALIHFPMSDQPKRVPDPAVAGD